MLFKRVSIALFCNVCNDQDILNRNFVPRTLYCALVSSKRLALCTYVALSRRINESTHSWIAKFLDQIFAVGANGADEICQIKAVLVMQSSSYQSEELGVSYGH